MPRMEDPPARPPRPRAGAASESGRTLQAEGLSPGSRGHPPRPARLPAAISRAQCASGEALAADLVGPSVAERHRVGMRGYKPRPLPAIRMLCPMISDLRDAQASVPALLTTPYRAPAPSGRDPGSGGPRGP